MSNPSGISIQIFDSLAGTWTGEGRGYFPTVTSFDIRGTFTFTRRDEKTIAYEQRAQKRYDGQTAWLESHWESGFIRLLANGELELTSAQLGRTEVLIGTVAAAHEKFRLHFISTAIANDARVVSSARTFELGAGGDTLYYEMEMHTTQVNQLTPHLSITFHRRN